MPDWGCHHCNDSHTHAQLLYFYRRPKWETRSEVVLLRREMGNTGGLSLWNCLMEVNIFFYLKQYFFTIKCSVFFFINVNLSLVASVKYVYGVKLSACQHPPPLAIKIFFYFEQYFIYHKVQRGCYKCEFKFGSLFQICLWGQVVCLLTPPTPPVIQNF